MSDISTAASRKTRVTVKDLARELGMSVSTVSRAFYEDAVIAPGTRETVLKRASEIGYAPNPLARSLITKKTRIAGVLVSDITNPFYPEVLTRLTACLRSIDLNVMLTTTVGSGPLDDPLRLLLSYRPDIVIVMAATLSSEAAAACRDTGTPVLFFNRSPSDPNTFAVTCDNEFGGRTVADHLIDRGRRRPAYVTGKADVSTNVDRQRGFVARCVERGFQPRIIEGGAFSYEHGYAAAASLAGSELPDAVFCANDILAFGFMDAARRELGLSIPKDVSVAGFDGISMAGWPSHALTTVRQPLDAMLDVALELIGEMSVQGARGRIVRIPGTLIVRHTTAGDADAR